MKRPCGLVGGLGGTYFWIDPKEEMIAVWIKSLVLQAIAD